MLLFLSPFPSFSTLSLKGPQTPGAAEQRGCSVVISIIAPVIISPLSPKESAVGQGSWDGQRRASITKTLCCTCKRAVCVHVTCVFKMHVHTGSTTFEVAVCVSWMSLIGRDWQWAPLSGLTASFNCTQREQIPIRARPFGQPAGEPPPRRNLKSSWRKPLPAPRATWGSLPPSASPQKGTFLWVTGNPVCAPPVDIKYLKTCRFAGQPTEDFNCGQREAWWNLPLDFPSRCMFPVMADLMKFLPRAVRCSSARSPRHHDLPLALDWANVLQMAHYTGQKYNCT